MKIVQAFSQVFAVFAFLTIGSLMIIVAMHILALDDAILRIREVYQNPWLSVRTGFLGLLFIMVGLSFARVLVKKGRPSDALLLPSPAGPIVLNISAVEDVVKKVLKRFYLVKEWKVKMEVQDKNLSIMLRLVLWSGGRIPEVLHQIQNEIKSRVLKLITSENKIEITCDIIRIEDHEALLHDPSQQEEGLISLKV